MGRRDDEARAARLLQDASAAHGELPRAVAERLDRVLEQLPAADTLHAAEEPVPGLGERLRVKRVRYALVSAAAAILVTIGGVATAVQYVAGPGDGDGGETGAAVQEFSADGGGQPEELDAQEDDSLEDELGAAPESAEETSGIATFSSGSDYPADVDLLTALRDLGSGTREAEMPDELAPLAAGGASWRACHDAIVAHYGGLIVAVDFARYDSRPAVVALLVSDSGDVAVAVTPECADGVVEELVVQQ